MAKLKEEGVFVRELNTLGIAYHSPALDPFCGRLRTRAPALHAVPSQQEHFPPAAELAAV